MDLALDGKTVVITGASGGIGRGLVQGFADEGCNVVLASERVRHLTGQLISVSGGAYMP